MLLSRVSEKKIRYWVELVNAEYGLSDKNEESVNYFKNISLFSHFYETEQYYLVLMTSKNMWGEKELNVISYYIKPEFRNNPRYLLEIQKLIKNVAIELKVKYINQGGHLNDGILDFLGKIGYKVSSMRKEI